MRAVFFGSPAFAVPCLEALADIADVAAVISQPDRPAGRGLALHAPEVKVRAEALGLPVWQPTKVRTAEFAARLRALEVDVGVVVAYGRILPHAVLDAPRLGCVNVHASLLPRWRGAAPIQWAIAHGDEHTGVTLMQMDEGMDTGPILASAKTPIASNENAAELSDRLAALGAALLRAELPRYLAGKLRPVPQDNRLATMAPLLRKQHGRIDWNKEAVQVHAHIRGMNPWPGAYSDLDGRRIKVHAARAMTLDPAGAKPGEVIAIDDEGVLVACGKGVLAIESLQESGRKRLSAAAFAAGHRAKVGERFSAGEEGATT